MTAEVIRPSRFSMDPETAGPVQRMRLGAATAANAFHTVSDGLTGVDEAARTEAGRAGDLADLAETLGRAMSRLVEETGRLTRVLRAE